MRTPKEQDDLAAASTTVDRLINQDPIGHRKWLEFMDRGKMTDPEAERIMREGIEAEQFLRQKGGGKMSIAPESEWDMSKYRSVAPIWQKLMHDNSPTALQNIHNQMEIMTKKLVQKFRDENPQVEEIAIHWEQRQTTNGMEMVLTVGGAKQ